MIDAMPINVAAEILESIDRNHSLSSFLSVILKRRGPNGIKRQRENLSRDLPEILGGVEEYLEMALFCCDYLAKCREDIERTRETTEINSVESTR